MNIGGFDRGKITEAQFWIGRVSAVAIFYLLCMKVCFQWRSRTGLFIRKGLLPIKVDESKNKHLLLLKEY